MKALKITWNVVALLAVLFMWHLGLKQYLLPALFSQTQIDPATQIKNFPAIVQVQRGTCVGSMPGNPSAVPPTLGWDCTGIELWKLTLIDGKVLGPFVATPATPQVIGSTNWVTIPLNQ